MVRYERKIQWGRNKGALRTSGGRKRGHTWQRVCRSAPGVAREWRMAAVRGQGTPSGDQSRSMHGCERCWYSTCNPQIATRSAFCTAPPPFLLSPRTQIDGSSVLASPSKLGQHQGFELPGVKVTGEMAGTSGSHLKQHPSCMIEMHPCHRVSQQRVRHATWQAGGRSEEGRRLRRPSSSSVSRLLSTTSGGGFAISGHRANCTVAPCTRRGHPQKLHAIFWTCWRGG